MNSLRPAVVSCFLMFSCWFAVQPVSAAVENIPSTTRPTVTADTVQDLIRELGAEEFAARERAQSELSRLGLTAFESLEEAYDHEDFEIRMRVRRLLDEVRGPLMLDLGIKGLEDLFSGYTELDEEKRAEQIETLGMIEPVDALPILTRFARFEESRDLAKRAALTAMQLNYPDDPTVREQLADQIQELSGLSKRTSVDWLRAFAKALNEPRKQLPLWREIQTQATAAEMPTEILREISQVHMDILVRAGEQEAALNLAKDIVGLGIRGRPDLADLADWALQKDLLDLLDNIYETHRDEFEADRSLLYRRAESQLKRGDDKAANQTAERAFQSKPDEKDLAKSFWIWENFQNDGAIHTTVASELRDRGLFAWSEREYRKALEYKVPPYYVYIKSHIWLSEMLHDQQQDQQAAKVLGAIIAASKDDEKLRNGFRVWDQSLSSIQSRMHYFEACHHEQQNSIDEQMAALQKGVEASPTDADVLIAMYRIPNASAEWQGDTRDRIRQAALKASESIRNGRAKWEATNNKNDYTDARNKLAQRLNDYAWLVGNTEGNVEQALRFSQESLRLRPGTPGYLDTLGRCYYRFGDYENAVKFQRQAVRRDPHSGQLLRQLELFESALADELESES